MNVDSAVAEIVEGLVPAAPPPTEPETPPNEPPVEAAADDTSPPAEGDAQAATPTEPTAESTPAPEEAPPDAWTKGAKEQWAALPPEIRAEIRKREGDFAKGISQYKQAADFGAGIVKSLEPFAETFRRTGTNPGQIIPLAIQAYSVMAFGNPEDKVQMFRALAYDAGIDIAALGQEGSAAATNEVAQLKQRLKELEGGVTSVTSSIKQARLGELEKSINAFAADETKHPYFWDVAMDMKRILETGLADNLEAAYDLAVWQNPVTRTKEMERQLSERKARETREAQERAEKARKAQAANVKATERDGRAPRPVGSLDETLAETLAEINSRTH